MPAVLRLMRQRSIVLAIDGFDELAAEQGSADALGALAMLVRDLQGRGVVIAASGEPSSTLKITSLGLASCAEPCRVHPNLTR